MVVDSRLAASLFLPTLGRGPSRLPRRSDSGWHRLETCLSLERLTALDGCPNPTRLCGSFAHADQAVTMEIYAKASSKATQEALRRLGESLGSAQVQ
jgi:hypothetical protein